ncbi:WG repeat-containing protein [Thiosocius teredinicola]|uniref:WG repeat-containing protein n=1 Tax=Thiosocius teredinicola TaxID=1973002 RepID=UPI000990D92F
MSLSKQLFTTLVAALSGNRPAEDITDQLWPSSSSPDWLDSAYPTLSLLDQLERGASIASSLEYGADAIIVRSTLVELCGYLQLDLKLPWIAPRCAASHDTDDHLAAYASLLNAQGWDLLYAADGEARLLLMTRQPDALRIAKLLTAIGPLVFCSALADHPSDFASRYYEIIDRQNPEPRIAIASALPNSDDADAGSPFVPYRKGDCWAISDRQGRLLTPLTSDWDIVTSPTRLSDDCWIAEILSGELRGWIQWSNGTVDIVAPQFSETGIVDIELARDVGANIYPHLLPVREPHGRQWGYANLDGSLAIDFVHREAGAFVGGSSTVATATRRGSLRRGLINASGDWLTDGSFSHIELPTCGLRQVSAHVHGTGTRYGYLDQAGSVALDLQYYDAQPFSHELALVTQTAKRTSGQCAVIDTSGKPILAELDDALPAQATFIAIKVGGKWGVVDHRGNPMIKPKYSGAVNLGSGRVALKRGGWQVFAPSESADKPLSDWKFDHVSERGYVDERCAVTAGDVFHIDMQANPRTPVGISDVLENYSAERCRIMRYADGLSGYIDPEGNTVIDRKYQSGSDFSADCRLAIVYQCREPRSGGFIDRSGNEFWED